MKIIVNGQTHQTTDGLTIADLLKELRLHNKPVAVEVNLHLVPKHLHAAHRLSPNDRLEIVTLVGGG